MSVSANMQVIILALMEEKQPALPNAIMMDSGTVMLTLPAQLSVPRYLLKIAVRVP